jgi:hypothetical protein
MLTVPFHPSYLRQVKRNSDQIMRQTNNLELKDCGDSFAWAGAQRQETNEQCLGLGIPEICQYISAVHSCKALLQVKPLAKMAFALQTRGLTARVGSKVSTRAVAANFSCRSTENYFI